MQQELTDNATIKLTGTGIIILRIIIPLTTRENTGVGKTTWFFNFKFWEGAIETLDFNDWRVR